MTTPMSSFMPHRYLLALGTCVPPAAPRMRAVIDALEDDPAFQLCGRSSLLHNPAVGGVTHQPFVNAVVAIAASLSPEAVLRRGFALEMAFGRVRTQKNAARTLDVDVVWSSCSFSGSADLLLPHPLAARRTFVTAPAAEAWMDAQKRHPLWFAGAAPWST